MNSFSKIKNIRFLILDIDGVLTDGGIYYTEKGDVFKKFHVRDGVGIMKLVNEGYYVGFLTSGSHSVIVKNRAKLLGVQFVFCSKNPRKSFYKEKLGVVKGWLRQTKLSFSQVAYVGDDINDLELMAEAGFTACPADAVPRVKKAVDVILQKKGGEGCVRECIERFIISV
ncbi:MAG: HAD-IIIA family hydrolase [Bacteroidetes bacterium]|nr:HAD-IIIA family hydrolase [Bacteroidota bacterium]